MEASTRRKILIGSLVLLSAIASLLCWLYEMLMVKGWAGLNWLHGEPYSIFVCAAFIVIATMLPALPAKQGNYAKLSTAFVLLYVFFLVAFFVARIAFSGLYSLGTLVFPFFLVVFGIALGIFVSGYYLVMKYLVTPVHTRYLLYLFLTPLACWGLSMLSISLFPAHGQDDFIHTVKAGHQQFWIGIVLAIATALGKKPQQ